jgi:hypothetical protein
MIISFCFTIKIMNSMDNLERYQTMIFKAVECAKVHHKVKFYTDEETIPYLTHVETDKIIINTDGFYFVDDFKIHLLSIIDDNEILIDTDLFLFSPLIFDENYDIYVDFKDNSKNVWYTPYLNWCIDNGIKEILPKFGDLKLQPPNIGILKITNKELKYEYIQLYNFVKKWILMKKINVDKGISIILGQYILSIVLQNNYKVYYCWDKHRYIHISGPIKFEPNILDNIEHTYNKKML